MNAINSGRTIKTCRACDPNVTMEKAPNAEVITTCGSCGSIYNGINNENSGAVAEFTTDWTHTLKEAEPFLIDLMPEPYKVLEVGAFEGRSVIHWATRWPKAQIDVIDNWRGGHDHDDTYDWKAIKRRYIKNVKAYGEQIRTFCADSPSMLMAMTENHKRGSTDPYDFVYIDASHLAADVCLDALIACKLVRVGGIMLFDDFEWTGDEKNMKDLRLQPKLGIASWSRLVRGWEIIYQGYGIMFQRAE